MYHLPNNLCRHRFGIFSILLVGVVLPGLIFPSVSANAAAPLTASITVDANQGEGPVNRYVFGHNLTGAANGNGIFNELDPQTPRTSPLTGGLWDPVEGGLRAVLSSYIKPLRMGMLRYPGGCLAHNYNWKEFVGPPENRPTNYTFGVDEYIRLCRELDTEPIITISDYYGTAEEAAEFVEYLNAPAIPQYPWAMKRAEWGNPEPYGVKWFELGNESAHGNHSLLPFKSMTSRQYADWALEYIRKMRAVDPTIKLGIITAPSGRNVNANWNRTVLAHSVAQQADFVVVHAYAPEFPIQVTPSSPDSEQKQNLLTATMVEADQLGHRLRLYQDMIQELSGRTLPVAVTEFNISAAENPYRFSFIAGLHAADFQRVCLESRNNIVSTNYWHLIDGHWGAIQRTDNNVQLHAPYSFFRLWADYLGDDLLVTDVQSPARDFLGYAAVAPAVSTTEVPMPAASQGDLPVPSPLLSGMILQAGGSGSLRVEPYSGNTLRMKLTNYSGSTYPTLFTLQRPASVPAEGVDYRLIFECRVVGAPKSGTGRIGVGMNDSRGYNYQQIGLGVDNIDVSTDWEQFSQLLTAPPDMPGVAVLLRVANAVSLTQEVEVRNIRVEVVSKEIFPAYPLLSARATKSADGKTLYLVVFNKSLDESIQTTVDLRNFAWQQAHYSVLADNPEALYAIDPVRISLVPPHDSASFMHTFPPCSMTGFTFSTEPVPEVSLSANDTNTVVSFNTAGNWSDGLTPSPDKDYLSNGKSLYAPSGSGNHVFAGRRLTLKGSSTNSCLALRGTGVVTVDDLLINQARIRNYGSETHLAGDITLSDYGYVEPTSKRTIHVHAVIGGSGQLRVLHGTAVLVSANNTYRGGTQVQAASSGNVDTHGHGHLDVRADGALGSGDVWVAPGARLTLGAGVSDAIADEAALILAPAQTAGSITLNGGVETIRALSFDGGVTWAANGTYGGPVSAAATKSSVFAGSGVLCVANPLSLSMPPQLLSAVSRKIHGDVGAFDIPVEITVGESLPPLPPVECRAGNTLSLMLNFDKPIISLDTTIIGGEAVMAGSQWENNTVTLHLDEVADAQIFTLELDNIVASGGGVLPVVTLRLGILAGDVSGDGVVSAADFALVRAAASTGLPPDEDSFRYDINANGTITAADVALARAAASTGLSIH